jgi:alpha-1,6-mannosyltransferase
MKKLLILPFLGVLYCLAYFVPREKFYLLISLFAIGFVVMEIIKQQRFGLQEIFWIGIVCRVICLFSLPMLSDDYFRFLWDGAMSMKGISPFAFQPEVYIEKVSDSVYMNTLYDGMNSKSYFTVYPPLNQLIFYIANLFSGSSILGGVIVIRLFLLLSEIIVFKGLVKILESLNMDSSLSIYYFLNPLIIMELFVNLHMESIMIAGFTWMLVFLSKRQYVLAAIHLFLSVNGKLHTLIFIPLLLAFLPIKDFLKFILVFGFLLVLSFLPLIDVELIHNIKTSLNLYFQSFEFNASLFYVVREIGHAILGYDLIKTVGPIFSLISIVAILFISLRRRVSGIQDLLNRSFIIFLIFLLFSSTVHPWYISMALLLGVINQTKSMILWSFLVMLTYSTYLSDTYIENMYLISIEYLGVIAMFIYEINRGRKPFTRV